MSITAWNELLYDMQTYTDQETGKHYPHLVEFGFNDNLPTGRIAEIDLETRTITMPTRINVEMDHNADILYFKCPRYFDNMDLASSICIVEYKNAEHLNDENQTVRDAGLYWVPQYDATYTDPTTYVQYLLIPWSVRGLATAYPGTIDFAVRFYLMSSDGTRFVFNLSTLSAQWEIKQGLDILADDPSFYQVPAEDMSGLSILQKIDTAKQDAITYWKDV